MSRTLRTWFATVTPAEFLGFTVPSAAGALTADASAALVLPVLLAAGAVEGAVPGAAKPSSSGAPCPR